MSCRILILISSLECILHRAYLYAPPLAGEIPGKPQQTHLCYLPVVTKQVMTTEFLYLIAELLAVCCAETRIKLGSKLSQASDLVEKVYWSLRQEQQHLFHLAGQYADEAACSHGQPAAEGPFHQQQAGLSLNSAQALPLWADSGVASADFDSNYALDSMDTLASDTPPTPMLLH